MQIRRQRPRTAANGFEKQDEASEAFKDIIVKYNIINDMTRHKLSGAGAAIPTPFTPDGRVDYPALARTIDYIIDGGVDFIVALGTTAETPTLYLHERAVVAGGAVPALQNRIGTFAPADHSLQRSRPYGGQYDRSDHDPHCGRLPECHRHQGGFGQDRPDSGDTRLAEQGFSGALGR